MPNPENLSRAGKGFTSRPRVYVGCLPCAQGYYVTDIEHANRWVVTHWDRCKRSVRGSEGAIALSRASVPSPRVVRRAAAESRTPTLTASET